MQGPAPSQAAQQGQHHAALSQPAYAPDSAAVANTAHDSAPPVAADSAPPVAAESATPAAAEATASMVAGPPSSGAADLATASTAGSASGGGAEEEAMEGTGHTPIVDSLSDSTMAEGRLLLSATDLTHDGNEGSMHVDTILFRLIGNLLGNLAVDRHCT